MSTREREILREEREIDIREGGGERERLGREIEKEIN